MCGFHGVMKGPVETWSQDTNYDNAWGGYFDTPLHAVSRRGSLEVVRFPPMHIVDVNT